MFKIWRTIGKSITQQGSTTNTTIASMAQETAAGMIALKPSSRKQRREFIKGLQRVTTDPNDLIQSEDNNISVTNLLLVATEDGSAVVVGTIITPPPGGRRGGGGGGDGRVLMMMSEQTRAAAVRR